MDYIVVGVRQGKRQEFAYNNYSGAFATAIEMKESNQYSVITILEKDETNNEFFLKRIIK